MGRTNKEYDSKAITNQKVGTGAQDIVLPFTPVVAGTFKVVVGSTVITDTGAGALSDGGTIDYASGVARLNAPTSGEGLMSYEYDNSNVPTAVGDLTMGINPVLIEAEEHKIKAVYALTAAYRINKEYGVNMPLEFEKQVANEMNKERERIVMGDIFAQAAGGNSIVWSSTPRPRSKRRRTR